ncbi:Pre-rRNA-processing protein IPI1/Testis-expressed sequence 10 protein [Macleaya cordata]|uniref:Pre-rRNA-processing protein IPI1/Testis-expressed sequence 10 protein n=1 Tax=Macleaya cordata TaxID=56857 RepID=A0A200QFC1_MACCD|nr:Pre-rRNA-processing protein IPI1/Testis-expressed sequence 10 protein [Macleaya cordata]
MVRSKLPSSKKQQKRGVDFKKIKRKIGRKLPPPKNATNTEIKSKAIILPEQSIASERVGLAVSKKGLTLKELLQQTSHHNAKVRKDALYGIGDLTLKYPDELRVHRLAIIEKLRERISDDDKVVRETLYELLKSVIFRGSKEDMSGPFISLIMAYIFNAMTHLAIDIRLMSFKFFDLVVQHYPSSFLSSAEKVLQNYGDILRKNHIFLDDRSKLKNALVGLVRCLSLLPFVNKEVDSPSDNSNNARGTLHAFEPETPKEHTGVSSIIKALEGLLPILLNCFQELTPSVRVMPQVDAQSFDCMSYVLQSIDLAVRFFVYGNNSCQTSFEVFVPSMSKGADVIVWGKNTMLMLLKKLLEVFPLSPIHHPTEKDDDRYYVLNIGIAEILMHISESIDPLAILEEKFLEFIENALSGQILCNTRSSRSVREKHLVSLLPFIPQLVSLVESNWKFRLLQAFTKAFKGCKPDSSLNLACLSAIEEMLLPLNRKVTVFLDTSEPEILDHQISWIRELPQLLVHLGDRHPSSSKVILHLQLRLGQCAPMNPSLAWEYDNMQNSLIEFYSMLLDEAEDEGGIHYGPFLKLPRDCQELSISSLYYFSSLDPLLLQSVASCCLCNNLEPYVLFRIIEVLHSSYKAGHIHIADYISFFVTLLARFKVIPEKFYCAMEDNEKISNRGTFKALTDAVCSCLSRIGDDTLVLQILQKTMVSELSLNPPLDNKRAMLRLLLLLDSRPTILPEESISNLANSVLQYLIDAASYIPENSADESNDSNQIWICKYYLAPCFFLFDRSDKLLTLVLNLMGSSMAENNSSFPSHHGTICAFDQSSRISAIASILLFMHNDVKLQRALSSCKAEIRLILRNLLSAQCPHGDDSVADFG